MGVKYLCRETKWLPIYLLGASAAVLKIACLVNIADLAGMISATITSAFNFSVTWFKTDILPQDTNRSRNHMN